MDSEVANSSLWRKICMCVTIPVLFLLCVGQGGHLWYITKPFFAGEITTVITEDVPEKVYVLGFNLCKKINNMTTVADAWNMVPNATDLLVSKDGNCGFVKCKDLIARKYFFNRNVCLVIEYKHRRLNFRRRAILALHGAKDLIEYHINSSMFPSDGEYTFFMADFNQPAIKYFDGEVFSTNDISGKSFTLHTHKETRIMLPGYEGHCHDYTKEPCGDSWSCFIQCLDDFMGLNFNLSAPAMTIYDPLQRDLMNTSNLPPDVSKKLNTAFKTCTALYPARACEDFTIFTHVQVDTKKSPKGVATFTWQLSSIPDKVTRDIPRISVVELFSFIQSSIGSWLSINLIDITPIYVYQFIVSHDSIFKEIIKIIFVLLPIAVFNLLVLIFITLPIKLFKLIRGIVFASNDLVSPFSDNNQHIQNDQNNLSI